MDVKITEKAGKFLGRMIIFNGGEAGKSGLRFFVKEGGCSGLSYDMTLADGPVEGDETIEGRGFKLFVPKDSMIYLRGVEVDYVDNMMNSGLVFNNPNASGQCGCGTSFSVPGGPEPNKNSCSKNGPG